MTGAPQRDGRAYVTETHIDHLGKPYRFEYLWNGADRDAILAARAARLAEDLASTEYAARVGTDGWAALQHQTAGQFAAKLRAEYREAARERICHLAWWLIRRIVAGDVTDAQVQAAFGLTDPQYASFKARAQALHDHWASVLVASGE